MYWTENHSLSVGFAIWALQRDGLRVPPFDSHPPGDTILQSAGLRESEWRSWVQTIIHAENQVAGAISTIDLRTISAVKRVEIEMIDASRDPIACWVGAPGMETELERLWRTYQPIGEGWVRRMTSQTRHSRISADQDRRLWRELRRFHDRLPPMRVYLVEYGQLVAIPIPPASCVIGIGAPDPDGRAYVDLIVAAARSLAATAQGDVSGVSPD